MAIGSFVKGNTVYFLEVIMEEQAVQMSELTPSGREKVKRVKLALEQGTFSSMEVVTERKLPPRMLGDLGIKPHIGPQ